MNINTRIAGVYFKDDDVKHYLKELPKGTKLILEPEPDNDVDANAIRVLTEEIEGSIDLGYISKDINESVLQKINEGIELIITYNGKQGINIRSKDEPTEYTIFGRVF